MAEDGLERYRGPKLGGPARTSPYPMSRLAPAHDLVDMARQIAEADHVIGTVVHAKLEVIAEQIRSLQAQARAVLEDARDNAALHRAHCRFQKKPGHVYHLYRRSDGSTYLSMLSPVEWGDPPDEPLGSYRLELDMSWSPAGEAGPRSVAELRALVGVGE
jgi:hypothetical protein